MTIQITKSGTLFQGSQKDIENLKLEFDKNYYIKLSNFFEKSLLHFIQEKLKASAFYEDRYKVGNDDAVGFCLDDDKIIGLIYFLLNDEALFKLIEQITGCLEIGCFTGRVYSKVPNLGQYDSWHDDLTDNRMVALSINLSLDTYSGGILQIKDSKDGNIISEVTSTKPGEAIIFRIAPHLEHRVTKVEGKVTRTVLTGWFRANPNYKPVFKALLNNSSFVNGKLTKHSKVQREENLFTKYNNEQLTIYDLNTSLCYGLDSIGEKILSMLDKPKTIPELVNAIHNEYDVEQDKCKTDIQALLDELASHKLITIGN